MKRRCNKVKYDTMGSAAYHAHVLHKHAGHGPLNIYYCRECAAYHVTRRKY